MLHLLLKISVHVPENPCHDRRRFMESTAISLTEEELMRLESIFMDKDPEEALQFLLQVIKPKIRAKGSRSLDWKKGTGTPR
jgi:hypothetical protein